MSKKLNFIDLHLCKEIEKSETKNLKSIGNTRDNKSEILSYKNLLLEWFYSKDLDTNKLREILDVKIPLDTGSSELNILLNSMGWWFDTIEYSSKSSIKSNKEYKKYIKKLEEK